MEKFVTVRLLSFTQFERVLFMDADTLALQRVDDVSRLSPMRLDQFAAAPQANVYGKGWSTWTGFNTGLMLLRPDEHEYSKFLNALVSPPPKRAREELAAGRALPRACVTAPLPTPPGRQAPECAHVHGLPP